MDARKVHELFISQNKQNAGVTTPVNQNIDFNKTANNLNQYSGPVQTKSSTNVIKVALGIGAIILVVYLISKMPKNENYSSSRQRRKQREKESFDKGTIHEIIFRKL